MKAKAKAKKFVDKVKAKAKTKRDTTVSAEGIDIPRDLFRNRRKDREQDDDQGALEIGIDEIAQWTIIVIGRDPFTFVTEFNPWPHTKLQYCGVHGRGRLRCRDRL